MAISEISLTSLYMFSQFIDKNYSINSICQFIGYIIFSEKKLFYNRYVVVREEGLSLIK